MIPLFQSKTKIYSDTYNHPFIQVILVNAPIKPTHTPSSPKIASLDHSTQSLVGQLCNGHLQWIGYDFTLFMSACVVSSFRCCVMPRDTSHCFATPLTDLRNPHHFATPPAALWCTAKLCSAIWHLVSLAYTLLYLASPKLPPTHVNPFNELEFLSLFNLHGTETPDWQE